MGDPFPLTGEDSARSPLVAPPLPEAVREPMPPVIGAALLTWLKEECERQHDRAEQAEKRVAELEAAAQQDRARLEEVLTCRNGGPHYCPNCDNTIELPKAHPPPTPEDR